MSCKQVKMIGVGTSSLPQLCNLEGRALPEEYSFDDEPPSTPYALAGNEICAQSAQAARHNMVPRYSQTDIRIAKATLSGTFDILQGMRMRQDPPTGSVQLPGITAADHRQLLLVAERLATSTHITRMHYLQLAPSSLPCNEPITSWQAAGV